MPCSRSPRARLRSWSRTSSSSARASGSGRPPLVLDANILVRAVLGSRVKTIITTYATTTDFLVPQVAYDDAERHLPQILTKHGRADGIADSMAFLSQLRHTVLPLSEELYLDQRNSALARIEQRDPDDWPVLAAALVFGCGIWTEDNDFFGTGVPTWTTDRVELYLKPTQRN